MKVLVIGSGGREHALVWKISQSPLVQKIYCAPGNAGINQLAECPKIAADDITKLVKFANDKHIDLTVVGPEVPLANGIVDAFQQQGLRIFGPDEKAAEIESSKAFAKYMMKKYNIPTAKFETFDIYEEAIEYVNKASHALVVKADGLAAGKGAIVCQSKDEARDALRKMMKEKTFGNAGNRVVIEECLQGEEVSVLAFTDGTDYKTLIPAQDHKPIFDGDKGPNTGGMGAYAPAVFIDEKMLSQIEKEIIQPTIKGMALEGRPYRGVLYAGLMITKTGPKVIEFNCRFGDPETQAILPLIKSDIVPVMNACIDGELAKVSLEKFDMYAVCVIMASGGYPEKYEKGKKIIGLDRDFGKNVIIFHAGTSLKGEEIVTSGGRVLGVTGLDRTVKGAIRRAYNAVQKITFDKAYYRKDIGFKAL